ncbi:MAG: hypothetical protein ACRETH_06705, partial [Steroidobacteraceae bacterium]
VHARLPVARASPLLDGDGVSSVLQGFIFSSTARPRYTRCRPTIKPPTFLRSQARVHPSPSMSAASW